MHTAIHSVAVFSLEQTAQELLAILRETEEMPEFFPEFDNDKNFVDMFEINFRNPPYECEGMDLIYVNYPENSIPDVYGY